MKNILILLAICCTCCSKRPECPGTIIDESVLSFILVSKGGIPLIGDYGRKYDKKYTEFLNANGNKVDDLTLHSSSGGITFSLIPNISNSSTIDSVYDIYYLKLPISDTLVIKSYDVDTVEVSVKAEYNPICRWNYLKRVEIKYNDSTYYESKTQFPTILKFTKK